MSIHELPAASWRSQRWRYGTARGGLIAEKCENGHLVFPPRDRCPEENCRADARETTEISGRGTIYSFSIVHDAPAGFQANLPYAVALVQLDAGPMIAAQLTDVNLREIEIGQPVEMVTRKISEDGKQGHIVYGYKFRPQLQRASSSPL